jgi:hypothetical protein
MLQVGIEPTTTASRAYKICIRAMLYQLSYWSLALRAKTIPTEHRCLNWELNPGLSVYKTDATTNCAIKANTPGGD